MPKIWLITNNIIKIIIPKKLTEPNKPTIKVCLFALNIFSLKE